MSIITNLFSGGAGEIIKQIGGVVDNLTTTKEEKETLKIEMEKVVNSHLEKMTEEANREFELQLKDVQNSRDSNVKIQESEHASWLAKNVAYCLDILLGVVWSIGTFYILARAMKLVSGEADMTIVLSIHGTITAVFMTIVNFHRGTSKGSEDKGKQLHTMLSGNPK